MMTKQEKRLTIEAEVINLLGLIMAGAAYVKDKQTFLAVLTAIFGTAFVGTTIHHAVDKIKDRQRS